LYAEEGEFKVEGSVDLTDKKAVANVLVTEKRDVDEPIKIATLPFGLDRVELMDDIFSANRDRGEEFLLATDDDRMLYNFRDVAGLDKKGAQPMLGWDAPEGNLKGHTSGHYLTAIAIAYSSSGDQRFKDKIDYMISELGKCQDALEASGKYNYGFLSAYSEEQFDKLEEYTVYPKIWAPYYTLHKIVAGLLDCHELGKNHQALEICTKLGTWVYNRLSRLPKEQLDKMWGMYIAGEFGGMNEVMARLYGITGNEDFLKTAKLFDNEKLFMPMERNVNTLGGMHANQHIPQIVGALKIYDETDNMEYYDIANNFWEMVAADHIYNIGGVGEGEMFKPEGKIGSFISQKTAESCATYNMLKLTKGLFRYKPEAKYMDYYERALYNHILASQNQSGPVGGSTYFMPLSPGGLKTYDEDGNSCCHGTGMESHIKYQESIYFHNDDNLYVNLYIPSKLNWEEQGVEIIQSGDYLKDNRLCFQIKGNGEFKINFRVPYWIEKGFELKVNGKEEKVDAQSGSFAAINRQWQDGDKVEVYLPFTFRLERTPDVEELVSIMYGPIVMVGKSHSTEYIELDIDEDNITQNIKTTDDPLAFDLDGLSLVPNYRAWNFPYHAYFKVK
ncbi:MAG TPA: beta-L-arabinofuranosidase domain-containing protein, partial [Clostridia bacterium]|nr:beta-L-arabinofuranosidase domain-containing protein [Clostridia bacterium]